MRVSWLGGWGVAPETLSPLAKRFAPGADHVFLPPVADAVAQALPCECLVAWSLGAWRVMDAFSRGANVGGRVLLLAPIVAFCSEYGLGGRCSLSQVRWLRRWMQRDPMAALADFHQRAGLVAAPATLPYALNDLLEGLDRLAEDASSAMRRFAAGGLPKNWKAFVGECDPLLDAPVLVRALPGCQIVPRAGHTPDALLVGATKDGFDAL